VESLNVELKRWIDPTEPQGIAKIVKATFALHNCNGGFLVIGFDDKTLQPDTVNELAFPRTSFSFSGRFYLRRLLQDDAVPTRIRPGARTRPYMDHHQGCRGDCCRTRYR
jgi:hypothetical protein